MSFVVAPRGQENENGKGCQEVGAAKRSKGCRIQAELTDIMLDPPCGILALQRIQICMLLVGGERVDMNGKRD